MTVEKLSITAILVPQGAEYQAVCRGLRYVRGSVPEVVPIPMGIMPVKQYFQTQTLKLEGTRPQILVMGLCGSLTPDLRVGDAVVYEDCLSLTQSTQSGWCDRPLTQQLLTHLAQRTVKTVTALSSDRFVHSAQEKRNLGQTWKARVVDMEGTAILEALNPSDFAVAMLRVVSDDCQHNMPNLGNISSPAGAILPGRLAIALLRQPLAGFRLVRGSLRGLRSLENLTRDLFR